MNSSIYRFTLDMHSTQSQISIPATLGDTSRKLYIGLTDGGNPFKIADGCLAKLSIKRPTGSHLVEFCKIENNTTIVYEFKQNKNTCAVEGIHECDITLYDAEENKITSPRFILMVSESAVNSDDLDITDDEKNAIDTMLASEASRQAAELTRVNSESLRIEAEGLREDAEQARQSADKGRDDAEALRASAEAARDEAFAERKRTLDELIEKTETAKNDAEASAESAAKASADATEAVARANEVIVDTANANRTANEIVENLKKYDSRLTDVEDDLEFNKADKSEVEAVASNVGNLESRVTQAEASIQEHWSFVGEHVYDALNTAVTNLVNNKADKSYVDWVAELANKHEDELLNKVDSSTVTELGNKVTRAENTANNAYNIALSVNNDFHLKANKTDVESLSARVTTAEARTEEVANRTEELLNSYITDVDTLIGGDV